MEGAVSMVVPVEQEDGTVTGLLCDLCSLNTTKQSKPGDMDHYTLQGKPGVWVTIPCIASLVYGPLYPAKQAWCMGHYTLQSKPGVWTAIPCKAS